MALTASTTAGDNLGTTLIINIAGDAGGASGDALTFCLYAEQTGLTVSFNKGTWTKDTAASGSQLGDPVDFETHVYTAQRGSMTGTVTVSWGGANIWRAGWMVSNSGRFNSGTPQDCTSTYNKAGSSGITATALAVSPANAAADLIVYEADPSGSAHSGWTAGLSEIVEFGGQGVAYEDNLASSGSTGNKTVTVANCWWSMGALALRVAAAGGGTATYSGCDGCGCF